MCYFPKQLILMQICTLCLKSHELKQYFFLFFQDPNALAGQTGPDHALIGGIVAVVVFVTLCSIFLLVRYLARHKGRLYIIRHS